jgi:transcriptional regulator with XRE-family HTH domain
LVDAQRAGKRRVSGFADASVSMDDIGVGRLIRLARIRRTWTQLDLATRAGVSRTAVSRVERGHLGQMPLDTVRKIAAALEIRVELRPRARAIDIDRVVNARHTELAGYVIDWLSRFPGWVVRPEVSFSEFGERGSIDLLCWHAATGSLLVIELKTELLDFGAMLATLHTKLRLARVIARGLGWDATAVSSCLLVADSTTNRRRAMAHRALLGSALPVDARELTRWLKKPAGVVRALRFVPDARPGHVRSDFAGPTRVRPLKRPTLVRAPRSTGTAVVRGRGSTPLETGYDDR